MFSLYINVKTITVEDVTTNFCSFLNKCKYCSISFLLFKTDFVSWIFFFLLSNVTCHFSWKLYTTQFLCLINFHDGQPSRSKLGSQVVTVRGVSRAFKYQIRLYVACWLSFLIHFVVPFYSWKFKEESHCNLQTEYLKLVSKFSYRAGKLFVSDWRTWTKKTKNIIVQMSVRKK